VAEAKLGATFENDGEGRYAPNMSLVSIAVPEGLFIDGIFEDATGGATFDVLDPATEAVIGTVADAAPQDGLRALDAASRAQSDWAATAPRARSEILRRCFELMVERADGLARLMVLENGKALADARAEVLYAAEFFRWFAEEAVRIAGEISVAPSGQNRIVVLRQPVGVSLLITPWNFPAAMLARKIAPALAAGCTVVCKPAEDTPLTALAIAELLNEAGLPRGVVNVVPTSDPGPLVSAILRDPRLRKLSFTGSTEVGRLLLEQAAPQVINCSMELGGNAPFIVFDDADLEQAIAGAMTAKLRNGGEACTAANRFYVARAIADEFSSGLADAMAKRRVGAGLDEGVDVGPLVNAETLAKVTRLVDGALADGARLLVGGHGREGKGYFYEPTVLCDVAPTSAILHEEIFGPVAPIVVFDSEDDVITWANETPFGLVAYLYSGDLARALRVAERLETGMVGINRGVVSDVAAPFGGMKQSGLGREGGHVGIEEFLETKYIATSW
jgi:succinate-semialdehyde dehydrogenase/glutarate-semialdehyde dehydrogenase